MERPTSVLLATAGSLPRAENASPLAHLTLLPLPERVPPVTRIVRPALEHRSINVRDALLIDPCFPTAVVFQLAPKPNSSTGPVEVASHATAAVRVALAQGPAIVSRVRVRPLSFAGDPVRQRIAAQMPPPSYPDSGYVSLISSPSHKYPALRSPSRFPASRVSTRQL